MNEGYAGAKGMVSVDTNPLFTNDTILPSQYFGDQHKLSPMQRLWLAILEDAIACVQKGKKATLRLEDTLACVRSSERRALKWKRELGDEAREWIEYIGTSDGFGLGLSFVAVCEGLDVDPDYLRTGLMRNGFTTEEPISRTRLKSLPSQLRITARRVRP